MNDLFMCRKFIPITRNDKCNCALVDLTSFFQYQDPSARSELVTLVTNSDISPLKAYLKDSSNLRVTDRYGNTLLHLSIIFKKTHIFDYLMTVKNINVNASNRFGQTCLHLAAVIESEHFVNVLIKKGGAVNQTDESCCTPLHVASTRDCPKIFESLLENGADINFKNLLGKTSLYHACQYGSMDSIYMVLYYGAEASLTDVYGVLPLTAVIQKEGTNGDIPQSHVDLHETLFNHSFGRRKIITNLINLTAAMIINSPLFPQILKKIQDVKYSKQDLTDLCRNLIFIKPEYFKMFAQRFGYILTEMLQTPSELHQKLTSGDNLDTSVHKLMAFLSMLFQFRPSHNFVKGSMTFTYFVNTLVVLYKEKKISMETLKQMVCFLYSRGLPCTLVHLIVVYENCGFCDIFKFMLDLDIVVTFERPKAVMPYLIYDVNLTMSKFIDMAGQPCKEYRSALKFFSGSKVRNFFGASKGARNRLNRLPPMPSLIELSRDVARKHIIDTFTITESKDFYRLLRNMPIGEVYKKILTYEKELY